MCIFWKSGVYLLQSSFFPHLLGADICVATSPVPVALHGFGVQSCYNPEIFTDTVQKETWDPQMVPHLDALTGAHLVFPLKPEKKKDAETRGKCSRWKH